MTPLTRSFLPAAALAALTVLVTGCGSAGSSVSGAALSSTAPSAPVSPASAVPVVYLAEGGSVGGTVVHVPACKTGCQLSGDSTAWLFDMTWPTWNSTVAVGTGTEKLDDCTPNCAAGQLRAVPVRVTLSRPVMVCVSGTGKWFWTRLSFIWPDGLPAAFSGGNAPLNPFDYPDITAQAAKSCP
jgi:hypothetical protein